MQTELQKNKYRFVNNSFLMRALHTFRAGASFVSVVKKKELFVMVPSVPGNAEIHRFRVQLPLKVH